MTIGEQIRYLRKYLRYTQKELGVLSNTSETTIKQYESGKRQPRIEQLQKIAAVFGGSVSDIFLLSNNSDSMNEESFVKMYQNIHQQDTTDQNYNTGDLSNVLNSYTHELGEFLYYNPHHKKLFDASMNVKETDVNFATEMLNRINGDHTELLSGASAAKTKLKTEKELSIIEPPEDNT